MTAVKFTSCLFGLMERYGEKKKHLVAKQLGACGEGVLKTDRRGTD